MTARGWVLLVALSTLRCGGPSSADVTADCQTGCATRAFCGRGATGCDERCVDAVFAAFEVGCQDTAADYFACVAHDTECGSGACDGFERAYADCYCAGRPCDA